MMKKVIATALIIILVISQTSWAGWLDNWFSRYTSTSPQYFEGQKRGYFTVGSFSARIPTSTTYPFSIELPRIRGGCGGIDAFLGGFGFVNFEYLVQKFQRLIQAAPAVAFQIALNTLSSQLSTIIGDVEKIINALNSIQLNECAILKPFTTIDLSKDNAEKQFVDAAQAALKTTGIADLWSALTARGSKVETKSGASPPADEQIKGCSRVLYNLLKGANSRRGVIGYLLDRKNQSRLSQNTQSGLSQNTQSELASVIRGFIGDLVITIDSSNVFAHLTPACSENLYQMFNEGTFLKRSSPTSDNCEKDSESFYEKVRKHLNSIYIKAKSKSGTLTTDEEQIIQISPLPVYKFVKYAVGTNDPSLLMSMADPIAKGLLFQAFLEVYKELYKVLQEMDSQLVRTNNTQNSNNNSQNGDNTTSQVGGELCNVTHIRAEFEELKRRAEEASRNVHRIYQAAMSENSHAVGIAHTYSNFEANLYKLISEKFSASVASRLVGGR